MARSKPSSPKNPSLMKEKEKGCSINPREIKNRERRQCQPSTYSVINKEKSEGGERRNNKTIPARHKKLGKKSIGYPSSQKHKSQKECLDPNSKL